jgi:carboxymethylenebutenolidase
VWRVKLREERVRIPAPDGEIQATVIEPVGTSRLRQAALYYTDIFQLTESTLRTARQLASAGFLVCVPEIYPRELPGVALEFDDAGKQAGLAAAAHTSTAQFDSDRAAALDYLERRDDVDEIDVVGFCLGGHLAFRAAFDPRVKATVCFYPTGLHSGGLGSDDPGSLAQVAGIRSRLMIIFGSNDPHVPADARLQTLSVLYAAGLEHLELHIYSGGEHAFMRDVGPRHDPVLTDLSLTEAISFLSAR